MIYRKAILAIALAFTPFTAFAGQSCEAFGVYVYNHINTQLSYSEAISKDAYIDDVNVTDNAIKAGAASIKRIMLSDCSNQKGVTTYYVTLTDQANGTVAWKGRLEWSKGNKFFYVVIEESSKQHEVVFDVANGSEGEAKDIGMVNIFVQNPKN